ncbi:MAG: hypothetical protein COB02_16315 [Candidatus Cloacimonadota bacterium]|nr:MAG: hypothetical protein COB02_16315 [Candidatus Cloacimonadota bacterium]
MELPKQGSLCWFDLRAKDTSKIKSFYKELLNWTFEAFGDGYELIQLDGSPIGGLCSLEDEIIYGNTPVIYFAVDELNPAIEKLKTLKAELVGERIDIGSDCGCFQNFKDPAGNFVALWASK